MKQWIIRDHILKPVKLAISGISHQTMRWFPDHPDGMMNTSLGDDFWNDPFPEKELAYNKVQDFFGLNNEVTTVARDLAISIRERLREQLTDAN